MARAPDELALSPGMSRRRWLGLGAGLCALALPGSARGAHEVPARQQAELVAKSGKYDRNMAQRAVDGQLRVLFASKRGSAASREFVLLATRRLAELGKIGALPLVVEATEVAGASELGPRLREGSVALAYLSTGLRSEVAALASQLRGAASVLTVGASPEYTSLGVALGFDLVNGSPSLLVNLDQARAQGVDFHSSFLRLARIIK